MKITVKKKVEVEVKTLHVKAEVRYWEDATVNGIQEPEEGETKIPCRQDDEWCPVIDLETGVITNWEKGVTAEIHYKVCDCGTYSLHDARGKQVIKIEGYVPEIMYPGGAGYGDYIIMKVNEEGQIENWKVGLNEFEEEQED